MFYPIAGYFVLCLTPTRHRSAAAKAEVVINVNKCLSQGQTRKITYFHVYTFLRVYHRSLR